MVDLFLCVQSNILNSGVLDEVNSTFVKDIHQKKSLIYIDS